MKQEDSYDFLVGKSKADIIHLMEDPTSSYDCDEWIYIIGRNFFGFKKKLYLFFKDDYVHDYFMSIWA
ncbi:hypothetical protein [Chryseobacterium limigenitum]|uniref:Uncharacterized protein n=1 Tax=Chryseobacterium limigenitum TaxID=1612149 RepID=A0A1K2IX92_9FLAO|nr:hypothetical protein [Chryseobacterium limigenitum]SFZ97037.1 hypothetical protein SAMN05216324_1359 [Chryseobacterium limigenitum]